MQTEDREQPAAASRRVGCDERDRQERAGFRALGRLWSRREPGASDNLRLWLQHSEGETEETSLGWQQQVQFKTFLFLSFILNAAKKMRDPSLILVFKAHWSYGMRKGAGRRRQEEPWPGLGGGQLA